MNLTLVPLGPKVCRYLQPNAPAVATKHGSFASSTWDDICTKSRWRDVGEDTNTLVRPMDHPLRRRFKFEYLDLPPKDLQTLLKLAAW